MPEPNALAIRILHVTVSLLCEHWEVQQGFSHTSLTLSFSFIPTQFFLSLIPLFFITLFSFAHIPPSVLSFSLCLYALWSFSLFLRPSIIYFSLSFPWTLVISLEGYTDLIAFHQYLCTDKNDHLPHTVYRTLHTSPTVILAFQKDASFVLQVQLSMKW